MFVLRNLNGGSVNYLVEFQHERNVPDAKKEKCTAVSVCRVYSGEFESAHDLCKQAVVATAEAWTSKSDNFCKSTGRKIALARALKKLFPNADDIKVTQENRDTRRAFWEEYFKVTR